MDKEKFAKEFKPFSIRKEISKEIDTLKKIDPLAEAEKFAEELGIEKKDVQALGFFAHIEKCKVMNHLMDITDDTKFNNTLKDYTRKIEDFGFVKVYEKAFYILDRDTGKRKRDRHFIYFHYEYSILLNFDTYRNESVNGGTFYYNWSPNDVEAKRVCTSSGCMIEGQYDDDFDCIEIPSNIGPEPKWKMKDTDYKSFREKNDMWWDMYWKWLIDNKYRWIWRGSHDAREGVKHKIKALTDDGMFVKKWKVNPINSLCNHGDWDRKRNGEGAIDKLTVKRFKMLPQDVQNAIGDIDVRYYERTKRNDKCKKI